MNRKQRRSKAKNKKSKEYSPLENSNDQPFKDHMLHMKEAHDVGHLLWLLNTGKLILPYHEHPVGALNLKLPFDDIEENYYKTTPNMVEGTWVHSERMGSLLKHYPLYLWKWYNIYLRFLMIQIKETYLKCGHSSMNLSVPV